MNRNLASQIKFMASGRAIICAVVFCVSPAVAETSSWLNRASATCGKDFITEVEDRYAYIVSFIEKVPPSDAEFLRKESKDAHEAGHDGRLSALMSNRYYYPFEVQDSFERVDGSLKGARKSATPQEAVTHLVDGLVAASIFKDELNLYLDFDKTRTPPVVSRKYAGEFSMLLFMNSEEIRVGIECILDQWK